jgi:hypothetical protein
VTDRLADATARAGSRHRDRLPAVRAAVLRLVVGTVVAAVVAAPLAVAWGVNRTRVQQTVGITPTVFSLTTTGRTEVRLGVAGTLYVPRSVGPLGVVAAVDGPGVPQGIGGREGDLASYVSPQMLRLYSGLFHDPGPALREYLDLLVREVWRQLLVAELFLAALGGLAVFLVGLLLPRPPPSRRRSLRLGAVAAVALLASSAVSAASLWPSPAEGRETGATGLYDLPALDGTIAAGTTTNSPLLRLVLGGAVPRVQQLIRRQEEADRAYRETAVRGLDAQGGAMRGPREGELAVLLQSDMHCNTTMIALQRQVVTLLRERFGDDVPAAMAITGDLTTNGTAAEGECIRHEAAIAQGAPVAAVTGNHESDTSVSQMKGAHMTVLSGSTADLGEVSVLGAGDPNRSELFGPTRLRGDDTEESVGNRLYKVAGEDRPDLVLVHEAYAAQAFVGVDDMTEFLRARTDPTAPTEDGIRDLPASAVLYGHWHRSIPPRVVWNSDGTWTLVMELDTSGGAVDTPTLGHFSTPWSRPLQEASFPVLFLDRDSGLVTGYQIYSFAVDGTVTVRPRVEVGPSSGEVRQPLPPTLPHAAGPPPDVVGLRHARLEPGAKPTRRDGPRGVRPAGS